ncbi:hypothetical protein L207DRAFT_547542 [Hyaloscypha variabilis F]|uniref:Uncharacterized protein n=1 Tax=Hyaloscypha variabilis (strain UAMH 11265 / GT02V1 / F) TaxID=1149755 RepID=A0A2J6R715_HYAVF|nr:hypothetical protein L207DRAFT_547542 [Hyaloscypha variabilis F]
MTEKAGQPDIVWGMFGGNNAFFGAIARACIYQPISPEHPFGWGLPWDEDPTGTGLCKQNIKLAETYLGQPAGSGYRKDFTKALNDIVTFAQGKQALNQPFDLYVSSYVQFFDNTTDGCDGWTFAHDRLSTGKPKLVKGLRTVINENVQQLNSIQADIIKNYQIPAHTPMNPNFRVHNSQPDSTFQGHRFCEQGHTFEDQYYNQDVWLWNLQYYDEKTGSEEVGVPTTTGGVEFMAAPPGLDVTQGFETVMGDDTNPAAVIPQGDDVNTQQYGFGWTARPFHPKYPGHTALANFFIQQMRNDNIPGVKPTASTAPTPPAPTLVCNGLTSNKYVTHDLIKDTISNTFCPAAVKQGPISQRYNQGTPEEVVITLTGPNGFKPSLTDCTNYLLGAITEECDTSSPPPNYKGGGTETIGNVVYSIQPQNVRQPAAKGLQYGCDSTYKVVFNEYTVWGHG